MGELEGSNSKCEGPSEVHLGGLEGVLWLGMDWGVVTSEGGLYEW